jgi:hypothetical protein
MSQRSFVGSGIPSGTGDQLGSVVTFVSISATFLLSLERKSSVR